MSDKKRIFSGIQSSGEFTIGNYFGAIKNWVKLQDEYDAIFSVVDLHAITVYQVPKDLRRRSFECAAMLIAAGIDSEKSLLFLQSHVPAHTELTWILNNSTHMGELSRMTQFKDKSKNINNESISVGLFEYPVLMASDILLYQADCVPVGEDQIQHIELTREIARRFNNNYSETFTIPKAITPKSGARIMSLQNPDKKMSKSDSNQNGFILMKDTKDVIMSKFKKAVTDSDTEIYYDKEKKPGVSNLLEIYSCTKQISIEDAQKEFSNTSYKELKESVGESVSDVLSPIQERFNELIKEKDYVNDILKKGSEQASYIANKTLNKVKRKVGFYSIK